MQFLKTESPPGATTLGQKANIMYHVNIFFPGPNFSLRQINVFEEFLKVPFKQVTTKRTWVIFQPQGLNYDY